MGPELICHSLPSDVTACPLLHLVGESLSSVMALGC